jgi:hypothetical protein
MGDKAQNQYNDYHTGSLCVNYCHTFILGLLARKVVLRQ